MHSLRLLFTLTISLAIGTFAMAQSSPVFIEVPTDLELYCGQPIPAPVAVSTVPTEGCGEVTISYTEYEFCQGYEVYSLQIPAELGWGAYIAYQNFNYSVMDWAEGALLYVNEDQAFLRADIVDPEDPMTRFTLFIRISEGRSWEDWSSLTTTDGEFNRTYRSNIDYPEELGPEPWSDWRYYEVDEDESQMSGVESLVGSTNRMIHRPLNMIYGAQIGMGANGYNSNYGLTIFSGGSSYVDGIPSSSVVSLYADLIPLGTVGELYCSDVILRSWIATNDCDRRSIVTSTLTSTGGSYPSDIDGNGQVNINDLIVLNSHFGTSCKSCNADISMDGIVNIEDFLIWNTAFNSTCE